MQQQLITPPTFIPPATHNDLTVATYAPLFNGFYNTWAESVVSDATHMAICDDPTCQGGESMCPLAADDRLYTDAYYDRYREFEREYCEELIRILNSSATATELQLKFEMEKLYSPKEYNFSTDAIYCTVAIGRPASLLTALTEDRTAFNAYIKERYTSYDGFMSSYSNDGDEWLRWVCDYLFQPERYTETWATRDFTPSHCIGSILKFLFSADEETQTSIEYICL